jgi:hypothetical protein
MDVQEVGWGHGLHCCGSGWGQVKGSGECCNEPSGSIKCGDFWASWGTISYSRTILHGVSASNV